MLITKEQQQSWILAYMKKGYSVDQYTGFIDGIQTVMEALNKKPKTVNIEQLLTNNQTHHGTD